MSKRISKGKGGLLIALAAVCCWRTCGLIRAEERKLTVVDFPLIVDAFEIGGGQLELHEPLLRRSFPTLRTPDHRMAEYPGCRSHQQADEDAESPQIVFRQFQLQGLTNEANQALDGQIAGEVREFAGDLSIKFCWCPAGNYEMGSPASEPNRFENEHQVKVALSGFWLGQTEVTQSTWKSLMESKRPSQTTTGPLPHLDQEEWIDPIENRIGTEYVIEGANYPAVFVPHEEYRLYPKWNLIVFSANGFCRKLTERERAAGRLPMGWEFRLPTEAEWEYACRAGTKLAYYFGDDAKELSEYGWWGGYLEDGSAKSEQYAHMVGQKKPNSWGLYDMHGNVWEWCLDNDYVDMHPGGLDPVLMTNDWPRPVMRGGSWASSAERCRSAVRYGYSGTAKLNTQGFRVALCRTRP